MRWKIGDHELAVTFRKSRLSGVVSREDLGIAVWMR